MLASLEKALELLIRGHYNKHQSMTRKDRLFLKHKKVIVMHGLLRMVHLDKKKFKKTEKEPLNPRQMRRRYGHMLTALLSHDASVGRMQDFMLGFHSYALDKIPKIFYHCLHKIGPTAIHEANIEMKGYNNNSNRQMHETLENVNNNQSRRNRLNSRIPVCCI